MALRLLLIAAVVIISVHQLAFACAAISACAFEPQPAPNEPPALVSIEPAIGSVEGGEFVTLRGANLNEVTITIGGVPCTDVASGTAVASCRTGGVGFAEGARDVVVEGTGGVATLAGGFTYECPWTTAGGRRSCGAVPPARRFGEQPVRVWLTRFEPGHGFVANRGPHSLGDPTDHAFGDQSVYVVTDGRGGRRTLTRLGGAPVDFTTAIPKLWIKLGGGARVAALELRLGTAGLASYFAFALEAHQRQGWILDGEWVGLTLSWAAPRVVGTPDRAAITDLELVVTDDGTGPVTLRANGLAMVEPPRSGVVTFTFDDNFASMYEQGARVLDAHAMPATAYTIVDRVGAPGRTSLTQLASLQARGWEIAAHAFTDAHHTAGYAALAPAVLEDDLVDTRAWLIANGFSGYDHCAYPHGTFDAGSLAVITRYFATCRTLVGQRELAPPSDPRRLRVFYVTDTVTLADARIAVDNAWLHHEWLVLVFHQLEPDATARRHWRIDDFEALVGYVADSGLPVATVGEVVASW